MRYLFFTFVWPCIVTNFFLIKPTDALISQIYFVKKFYMFRAVPLPIIGSFPLYIRHWYAMQVWWQLSSTTSASVGFTKKKWDTLFIVIHRQLARAQLWLTYAYVHVQTSYPRQCQGGSRSKFWGAETLHRIFCVMTDRKTTQDATYSPVTN